MQNHERKGASDQYQESSTSDDFFSIEKRKTFFKERERGPLWLENI